MYTILKNKNNELFINIQIKTLYIIKKQLKFLNTLCLSFDDKVFFFLNLNISND